ncbi:MAG: ADOP family duplicated permease [Acidobacteriota bacterium]
MPKLRQSVRRLQRQPGFALLAVLTLALGLGAQGAMFAVLDTLLLRPLPYPDSEQMVTVRHSAPGLNLPILGSSNRLYLHYQEHSETLQDVGIYFRTALTISDLERPVNVDGAMLTPSVLRMTGARPITGRLFSEDEGAPGAEATVVVAESFWKRHLGSDPRVLERSLKIDGTPTRIVGVLPDRFRFPEDGVEIWGPLVTDPANAPLAAFSYTAVAKLGPGVSGDAAQAELKGLLGDLRQTFPEDPGAGVLADADFGVRILPLRDELLGSAGPVIWLAFATVALVLLLAVANVANLFVARAQRRRQEFALRRVLGASRKDLVSGVLADGMAIALGAGILGIGLSFAALELLLHVAPDNIRMLESATIGARGALLTLLLSLGSGLVFALAPLLQHGRRGLDQDLRSGGRSSAGGRAQHRLRRVLVAAQMTIAVLLLVGAGLLGRSFAQLSTVDPGFEPGTASTFRLSLPPIPAAELAAAAESADDDNPFASRGIQETRSNAFFTQLLENIAALPGVESVASSTRLPLEGRNNRSGHQGRGAANQQPSGGASGGLSSEPGGLTMLATQSVSPGYFSTLGIPLLEGRLLNRDDWEHRRGSVVISQAAAWKLWPNESAIGKQIYPGTPGDESHWMEVVGVVGDVYGRALNEEAEATAYYPWANPQEGLWDVSNQALVVRWSGGRKPTAQDLDALRQAVWALNPELPLAGEGQLREFVQRSKSRQAFTALLLSLAAGIALLLGAVGTYGVISYLVSQRTRELGVRRALGARPADVHALVLREGLSLAAAGVLLGLGLAALLASSLQAVLFGISTHDPAAFLLAPASLILVVLVACWIPARRAASVSAAVALREG